MPRWSSNKAQGRGPRSPLAPSPLQPESQMAEPTATAVIVNVGAPASLSSTHRQALNRQDPSPADAGSSSHDARIMQPGNLEARRPTLHEDILSVDIKPTSDCGTRLRRYNPIVYPPKPAHPLRKDRRLRLLVPQSSTSNDATNPNTTPDTDTQASSSRPETPNLTPDQLDDVHDVLCQSLQIYERLLTHPWEKNCKACHRLRAFFVRNYEHSQVVELKMAKDICSSRGCTGCASCTRTSNGQNGAGGTERTAESGRSAKAQTSAPSHPSSPSRSPQVPDNELKSHDAQERQNDGDVLNQPGTKPTNATQNQPNNGDAGADNYAQVIDETVNNTATGFSGSWFAPLILPGQPSSHTSPPNAVPVGQEGHEKTVNHNPSGKRPCFRGVLNFETRILDPRKTNEAVNVPSESGIDSAATDSAPMPAPAAETSSALANVPVPASQTHDSPAERSPSEDFRQITDSALVSIGSPKIRNRRWSRKGSKQRKQDENRDPNADGSGSDDGKGDKA